MQHFDEILQKKSEKPDEFIYLAKSRDKDLCDSGWVTFCQDRANSCHIAPLDKIPERQVGNMERIQRMSSCGAKTFLFRPTKMPILEFETTNKYLVHIVYKTQTSLLNAKDAKLQKCYFPRLFYQDA